MKSRPISSSRSYSSLGKVAVARSSVFSAGSAHQGPRHSRMLAPLLGREVAKSHRQQTAQAIDHFSTADLRDAFEKRTREFHCVAVRIDDRMAHPRADCRRWKLICGGHIRTPSLRQECLCRRHRLLGAFRRFPELAYYPAFTARAARASSKCICTLTRHATCWRKSRAGLSRRAATDQVRSRGRGRYQNCANTAKPRLIAAARRAGCRRA